MERDSPILAIELDVEEMAKNHKAQWRYTFLYTCVTAKLSYFFEIWEKKINTRIIKIFKFFFGGLFWNQYVCVFLKKNIGNKKPYSFKERKIVLGNKNNF